MMWGPIGAPSPASDPGPTAEPGLGAGQGTRPWIRPTWSRPTLLAYWARLK